MYATTLELSSIALLSLFTLGYLGIFTIHYLEGAKGLLPFTWIQRHADHSTHVFVLCVSVGIIISATGNYLVAAFTGHSFIRMNELNHLGALVDFIYLHLVILITLSLNYRLVFPVYLYKLYAISEEEYSIEGIIRDPIRTKPLVVRGVMARNYRNGVRRRIIF